jgi:hypothetical protein
MSIESIELSAQKNKTHVPFGKICVFLQDASSQYYFGRWNLNKNRGFNICSGPSDYYAQWFPEGDKWCLYITSYSDGAFEREKKLLHTADSIFDVFEYMRHNTHPVE